MVRKVHSDPPSIVESMDGEELGTAMQVLEEARDSPGKNNRP
jgi:hypothetical protein